jgi:RHS repeat-associated protein
VGNIDRTDYQYRFNNEVLAMRMTHKKTGENDLVELYQYDYDHVGRKTRFRHSVGEIKQTIATYIYDNIGRLSVKNMKPIYENKSKCTCPWTDPKSWTLESVPTQTDNVIITLGTDITIAAGEVANARTLTFEGGRLRNFGKLNLGNFGSKLPTNAYFINPGEELVSVLQTIDYKYHIRGNLRGINLDANNNTATTNGDLFSMKLGYETDGYFDGNIGKQDWKTSLDNVNRSFTYTYDGASRIKSGTYAGMGSENYSLNNVNYDANGNITNLSRSGYKSNNTFGIVDNLSYTYNTNSNKILKVDDASNETASFKDVAGNDYLYSADGSLISDANKGITLIEYNYLKLPKRIVQNGVTTLYQYDATGKKLKETIGTQVTDYVGNKIYKANILYQIGHDEGRIIDSQYEYNIKDHLGNLRVAFRDSLGIAKITQANSYGIWGEDLPTLSYLKQTWKADKFKQTGKEFLVETGYTDFGARLYDNLVPRFLSIDEKSEKWSSYSPFSFVLGNPLKYVDIDGKDIYVWYNVGCTNR